MITDELVNGIASKLQETFGEAYEVTTDELKQEFCPPAFWVLELTASHELVIRNRYRRKYNFDIQYFPKAEFPVREINVVTDTLLMALEYITVGNNLVRGSSIHCEVQDRVLHFFITYDVFVEKILDQEPFMERLVQTQRLKQ